MPNGKPKLTVRRKSAPAKKRAPRRSSNGPSEVLSLARLLNDPCEAPLVAPQYGASSGGYLTKLSRFFNVNMSEGTSGYCVWFPDYTGRTYSGGLAANCFCFANDSAGAAAVNTTAAPMGAASSAGAINGVAFTDPAYTFVSTEVVQDCRTASACVKMTYTGRNDALAGRVGIISGFSRDALLVGNEGSPPTISEFFNYATDVTRTPMDVTELKFKPSEGSEFYRNVNNIEDVAFEHGTIGTSALKIGAGSSSATGTGIGFCWSGLDPSSSLTFDFLKNIEWRPEFSSSLASPPQTVSTSGGNLMSRAVAYLDKHAPGWHQTLTRAGQTAAARIAQTAFSGPSNALIRQALPMLLM